MQDMWLHDLSKGQLETSHGQGYLPEEEVKFAWKRYSVDSNSARAYAAVRWNVISRWNGL